MNEQDTSDEQLEELDTSGEETPKGDTNTFRVISSQDELDRVMSERLKRERSKYADYTALKAKAGEYDRLADERKTEAERLQSRTEAAEAQVATLAAKVRVKALRSEVIVLSSKLGIVDADVALALIGSEVEYGDDDEPKNIEDLLRELIKQKPFLKAPRFDGPADGGTRDKTPDMGSLSMTDYLTLRNKKK